MATIEELAGTEYCYLTTNGRRTGEQHRIEIWFVAHENGAYLLSNSSGADWYRNLEATPEVALEIAGERRATVAHAVPPDDPANLVVRPAMVTKYQANYQQEDLRDWSREASLVRIEWPPEP